MKKNNYSLSDFGVTRYEGILSNGLRVVFIEKPFAPINAKIMMRAGAIFDPVGKEGLAHFTEHVIASGSKELSKEAFSGLLESIGGYWNATTGGTYMSVECEVALVDHLENVKQYFTHALKELHITEEALIKEKGIIISEIERARSKPAYDSYWYVARHFANGTLWNRQTLGTKESVSAVTCDDLQNFFETYCVAENMVLVISGGCSWQDIEKTFSTVPLLHGKKHELPEDPLPITDYTPVIYEQDIPQTNIGFFFLAPKDETRETSLLNFALRFAHDGITSRFYKKIRTEKGLAYGIGRPTMSFNKNTSYTGTQVGVPTDKVEEAIEAIKECYEELLKEGISQKEIDDKIDTLWFSAHRNTQQSSDWVDTVDYDALYPAENPLYGPYPDIYNYRRTYKSEEIKEVLEKYITLDKYYLVLNGKEANRHLTK